MAVIPICDETIAAYDADGVALLRGAFLESWISLLREAVEQVMFEPGPLSKNYAEPGRGKFFTDHHMHHGNPLFARFIKESPAVEIPARVLKAPRPNYGG